MNIEQQKLNEFIARAGFTYGWSNLESWARRMAEQAVQELQAIAAAQQAQQDSVLNVHDHSEQYREEFLNLALECGARLTGTPDGEEPIQVVFSIPAWRKFDVATKELTDQEAVMFIHPMDIGRFASGTLTRESDEQIALYEHPAETRTVAVPESLQSLTALAASWEEGTETRNEETGYSRGSMFMAVKCAEELRAEVLRMNGGGK